MIIKEIESTIDKPSDSFVDKLAVLDSLVGILPDDADVAVKDESLSKQYS